MLVHVRVCGPLPEFFFVLYFLKLLNCYLTDIHICFASVQKKEKSLLCAALKSVSSSPSQLQNPGSGFIYRSSPCSSEQVSVHILISKQQKLCISYTCIFSFYYKKLVFEKVNLLPVFCFLKARFLLSKVNPSQTHNNMYAWGQVSKNLLMKLVCVILFFTVSEVE